MSNYFFYEITAYLNKRKDDKKDKSNYYFKLASQYYTSPKLLFEIIVNNENKSFGMGDNAKEVLNDFNKMLKIQDNVNSLVSKLAIY